MNVHIDDQMINDRVMTKKYIQSGVFFWKSCGYLFLGRSVYVYDDAVVLPTSMPPLPLLFSYNEIAQLYITS